MKRRKLFVFNERGVFLNPASFQAELQAALKRQMHGRGKRRK
jgi:hypothetical protein